MASQRPLYVPEKDNIDTILDTLGIIGLVVLLGYPWLYFNELPEQIPGHFNIRGEVDAWGSKWTIWTLPAIGLVIYIFFGWIKTIPHKYNYPVQITRENAAFQYKNAVRMMRFFQMAITLTLAYIIFITTNTALGQPASLGPYFTPAFLLFFCGGAIYFALQSAQDGKD